VNRHARWDGLVNPYRNCAEASTIGDTEWENGSHQPILHLHWSTPCPPTAFYSVWTHCGKAGQRLPGAQSTNRARRWPSGLSPPPRTHTHTHTHARTHAHTHTQTQTHRPPLPLLRVCVSIRVSVWVKVSVAHVRLDLSIVS